MIQESLATSRTGIKALQLSQSQKQISAASSRTPHVLATIVAARLRKALNSPGDVVSIDESYPYTTWCWGKSNSSSIKLHRHAGALWHASNLTASEHWYSHSDTNSRQ